MTTSHYVQARQNPILDWNRYGARRIDDVQKMGFVFSKIAELHLLNPLKTDKIWYMASVGYKFSQLEM